MAERYGVGANRPEAQGKPCSICTQPIGEGYIVFLGERYFHDSCFLKSEDTGATQQQVRYLRAALESVKIFSPIWRKIKNAN
jgi:hypothetical protein